MALSLPSPRTEQLPHAPLQLVVCQVRHDRNLAVADAGRALAVRDALAHEYPVVEEQAQQELSFVAGPLGVAGVSGGEQRGWRFQSEDKLWTIALLPDFFALECTGYTSWSDFRARLTELARAVEEHLRPALEMRLGLRFVDQIRYPRASHPASWSGLIEDALLGAVQHAPFADALEALQSVAQLRGTDAQVLLRHGTSPDQDGNWTYLLDTDCFRSVSRRFSAETLLGDAEGLHRLALQVFQASITDRLYRILAGEEEP